MIVKHVWRDAVWVPSGANESLYIRPFLMGTEVRTRDARPQRFSLSLSPGLSRRRRAEGGQAVRRDGALQPAVSEQ